MGLDARKPVFSGLRTGADQPAHPRSLISALVIRFIESIICKLAASGIQFSSKSLEETGLKLALSVTPKTEFLAMRPIRSSGTYEAPERG